MHGKVARCAALFAFGANIPVVTYAHPTDLVSQREEKPKDIVVTASPFGLSKDDTPAIAAKVTNEQLLKQGGASIADALANVPGMASSGFASGASRPIIRGMDANRVRLLEDGVSSSDVSDVGPDHGVPLDPLAARAVEVIRGAATLRYGSQAIGGVVNAINNRVPTELGTKPFAYELTGSFAANANVTQGSALADVSQGDFAIHADAFARDADAYDTPIGKQQNSFFRGQGESFGGSWFPRGGESYLGAAVTQYRAKYGIPSDTSFIDLKQTKLMVKSAVILDSALVRSINLDGTYADYEHSERALDGAINATFKNRESDARAEVLLNPIGPLKDLALGVEHQHRRFSALGDASSYLLPTTTRTASVYLFMGGHITDSLRAEASARVERVNVQGTPASGLATRRQFTPISGAAGLLYQPTRPIKLGLTYAHTARAPGITELFARGAHDGPGTFETGQPNLRMERVKSLEASLRVRSGPFKLDASFYTSHFRNYVFGDLTGSMCDEDGLCAIGGSGELRELIYRQQRAHFRGVEGEANVELVRMEKSTLSARLFGDYTRATLGDGANVPRIPPYRIGGGMDWTSEQLDAGTNLTYVGKQTKVGIFDTATPNYVSLSAQIAWRPFKHQPGFEVLLAGQNLTNDVQRNAAALNKDLVVMPGRNVRFVVKFSNF